MQVTRIQTTKAGAEISFVDSSADQATSLMSAFLTAEGFRLETGSPGNGEYGQGKAGARVLAGGLVKRRKYRLVVNGSDDGAHASLESTMSGWSGSLMGAMREQKGRKETNAHLQAFLAPYMSAPIPDAPGSTAPPPPPAPLPPAPPPP